MATISRPRTRVRLPGRRLVVAIPLIGLPLVLAGDLASVALVKLTVPDDAAEAARAGVTAVQYDRTPTQQTALAAFTAAREVAALHRMQIDEKTFTVYADGAVKLTASRNAPTLLFKRLPWLRDHTETTTTTTVDRPNW